MNLLSKILQKYSFILGLILFIIILSKSNLGEIFQNIRSINASYLILAALLTVPLLFLKALCWNYIKQQQGIKYNLKDSFLMYCSGQYIGILTPGRLGEVTKALYLKRDGHSMGKSLVSVILDRLSDLAFLLIILCFGSLFLVNIFQKQILTLVSSIIILVLLFILFLKIGLVKWIIGALIKKSWKISFQNFINDFKIYKLKHYLIIFLITTFSWTFYYLQTYVLAKSINLNVSLLYLAISVTIAGFITLLPISISGIGTRDAALILLFAPLLIVKEQIIVFSTLILLMSLFAALIGLICWIIKPITLSTGKRLDTI